MRIPIILGGLALVTWLIISLISFFGLLFTFSQKNFIYQSYYPNGSRTHLLHPSHFDLPSEEVWLQVQPKVKVHGYLLKQREPLAVPTLIWCHGSGGNIVNIHLSNQIRGIGSKRPKKSTLLQKSISF